MEPLVSVILPTYNRENTIERALDSVLKQTYRNLEIIVVDDGSTDMTIQVVNACKDSRVRLVRLASNCGANVARNKGIEHAKGTFIAFQDSDDEWLEEKLDKQIRYMLKNDIAASYCPYLLYEDDRCYVIPSEYKDIGFCEKNIADVLKRDNVVGTPTLVIRKDVFSVIGLFDEEMKRMQDYELMIRLVKEFRVGYIAEPLVKAYRLKKSISMNCEILTDAYIKLLKKHIDFLDLEKILYDYYEHCNFSQNKGMNWDDIDRVMNVVRYYKNGVLEKEGYRITTRYLYEQYDPMKNVLREWYLFFSNYIEFHEFAIYGAGAYGRKAYEELKKKNCIPKYFLVTERFDVNEIEGIPLISIKECIDKEIPVIVAVSWKTQGELIRNLLDKGMNRFCVYPFCHSI